VASPHDVTPYELVVPAFMGGHATRQDEPGSPCSDGASPYYLPAVDVAGQGSPGSGGASPCAEATNNRQVIQTAVARRPRRISRP
jgi:hypothetical protein